MKHKIIYENTYTEIIGVTIMFPIYFLPMVYKVRDICP